MAQSGKNFSTQKTLVLAQVGVLSALITVMTFIPYLGYISYGGLSITLLHIPVIIGAVVLGPKIGGLLGGVWGVTCIIKAVLAPPTPLEGIIFRNPIIALIPRIIVGFVAGAVFVLISKNDGPKKLSEKSVKALSAVISTLLVIGACFGLAFLSKKLVFKNLVLNNPQLFYIVLIVLLCVVAVAVFVLFYKKTN
ncbi:MAG TPA: ECF transporter S component, partial [Clostridia bacterium]|nr:ECF transporter S component [Clostridia bacterium]